MIVLFLDIDGVANCATTHQRSYNHPGIIGFDPFMVLLIHRIVEATNATVVLSSSWRLSESGTEEVKKGVISIYDKTPRISGPRGGEIKAWLEAHPEVKRYAILDDDSDMLEEQLPNFFKTEWKTGLTEEIADKVILHLKIAPDSPVAQLTR